MATSDAFHTSSSNSQRASIVPRSHMYAQNNGGSGYRGMSAPVAPYAFQHTPQLRPDNRPSQNPSFRTSSAPMLQPVVGNLYPGSTSSSSTVSSVSSSNPSVRGVYATAADNIADNRASVLVASTSTPDLLMRGDNAAKPSPDRYRRVARRADSANAAPTLQTQEKQRYSLILPGEMSAKTATSPSGRPVAHGRTSSADDSMLGKGDSAMRYRRRSLGAFEPGSIIAPTLSPVTTPAPAPAPTWASVAAGREKGRLNSSVTQANTARPVSFHDWSGNHDNSAPSQGRRPSAVSFALTELPFWNAIY